MVETRRRRQIEDAASELFRDHGYAATSVRDIARVLDIRGASLYAHVTSKEDVLWAIVDRAACSFEAAADAADAATRGATAPVRLRAFVLGHLGVVTADPEAASVFDREWRHLAGARRADLLARRDRYEAPPAPAHRGRHERGRLRRRRSRARRDVPAHRAQRRRDLVPARRPVLARRARHDLRGPRRPLADGGRPMTDPLALAPVLPAAERRALRFNDEGLAHDERFDAFVEHVHAGGKVEATDWMPDEYRRSVLRFVEMHANSELMGVLPERDWILRAPTLRRKLALTAKIQDEVGHAQLLYRVAEDLGKPRDAMIEDLLAGKTKFHNVFHYPTRTWADIGVIAWLVDAAAIVAQQALRDSSYAPYARTMRKICWEESVHIMHGRDVVVTLATGTPMQRDDPPGGARPLVAAADADARPAIAARPGPRPVLADQGEDLGGAAPGVPGDLRAADPGARADPARPGARPRPGDGRVALHRARLGRAPRRRHRPRAGVGGQDRVPAAQLGRAGVGADGRRRHPPRGRVTP